MIMRNIKRKLQLICIISALSTSVLVAGCSKKSEDKNVVTTESQASTVEPEETTPIPESSEPVESENGAIQENSNKGDDDKNEPQQSVPAEQTQTGETSNEVKSEDKFFYDGEGRKIYDVCTAYAKAYLEVNDEEAKKYFSKNAEYDSLVDPYKSIELLDLKCFNYDEKKKEASVSYQVILDGEDSYTYLTMDVVNENDEYKISFSGLEK